MKRTTVSLPDDLASAVRREAGRRNVSVSEITRTALSEHLGLAGDDVRPIPFAALGDSGTRTTARDAEKILQREWGRARGR
jgi:Arc/MetJ-type ribon-helix-helix transcriptional regulator